VVDVDNGNGHLTGLQRKAGAGERHLIDSTKLWTLLIPRQGEIVTSGKTRLVADDLITGKSRHHSGKVCHRYSDELPRSVVLNEETVSRCVGFPRDRLHCAGHRRLEPGSMLGHDEIETWCLIVCDVGGEFATIFQRGSQ